MMRESIGHLSEHPAERDGRSRVDREQAFQFWVSLPFEGRSYAAVAKRFGISPRTVERYARDGRWRLRLARIEADATARADEKLGKKRAQQLAEFWRLIEASCVTYARQLAGGEVRISTSEFTALIKAALLLQGAPVERIEVLAASEEWTTLRGRILEAVAPFPEARLAIADALSAGEEEADGHARI